MSPAKRLKATHRRFWELADPYIFRWYMIRIRPDRLRDGNNELFKQLTLAPAQRHACTIAIGVSRSRADAGGSLSASDAILVMCAIFDVHARLQRMLDTRSSTGPVKRRLLYEKLEELLIVDEELAWLCPWIVKFASGRPDVGIGSSPPLFWDEKAFEFCFDQLRTSARALAPTYLGTLVIVNFREARRAFDILEHCNVRPVNLALRTRQTGWAYTKRCRALAISRIGQWSGFSSFSLLVGHRQITGKQAKGIETGLRAIETWPKLIMDLRKEWKGKRVLFIWHEPIEEWEVHLQAAVDADAEVEDGQSSVNMRALVTQEAMVSGTYHRHD